MSAMEAIGMMDGGELMFIVGICIGFLFLLKTCISMCGAILNPPTEDEPVAPAGMPAAKTTLLADDVESGRGATKGTKRTKLSHAKAPGKHQSKHLEPLQPLMAAPTAMRPAGECASP